MEDQAYSRVGGFWGKPNKDYLYGTQTLIRQPRGRLGHRATERRELPLAGRD